MRSARVTGVALGVLLLAAGVVAMTNPSEAAGAGPVFGVVHTDDAPPPGVLFRNSPHLADTDHVTGHGVYAGERVELL